MIYKQNFEIGEFSYYNWNFNYEYQKVILMIACHHQSVRKKNDFSYYYCDHVKECMNQNRFVAQTRKKLMEKKLNNSTKNGFKQTGMLD